MNVNLPEWLEHWGITTGKLASSLPFSPPLATALIFCSASHFIRSPSGHLRLDIEALGSKGSSLNQDLIPLRVDSLLEGLF